MSTYEQQRNRARYYLGRYAARDGGLHLASAALRRGKRDEKTADSKFRSWGDCEGQGQLFD